MAFAPAPTSFIPQRSDQIRNGTVASANLIETVRRNQLWLASQDSSFSNFYVQPKHVAGAIEIVQAFRIPPFCSYVEFWFWAAGTFNVAGNPPSIMATSLDTSDEVLLNMIPSGSDTTLKPSVMREDEAEWVSMRGLPYDFPTPPPGTRALRVADPNSVLRGGWRNIRVKIETSGEHVQIYTAAIRTVPARGLLST